MNLMTVVLLCRDAVLTLRKGSWNQEAGGLDKDGNHFTWACCGPGTESFPPGAWSQHHIELLSHFLSACFLSGVFLHPSTF